MATSWPIRATPTGSPTSQQSCANLLSGTVYDGCYLDMLGTAPLWPGYATGLPINPVTASGLDEAWPG